MFLIYIIHPLFEYISFYYCIAYCIAYYYAGVLWVQPSPEPWTLDCEPGGEARALIPGPDTYVGPLNTTF